MLLNIKCSNNAWSHCQHGMTKKDDPNDLKGKKFLSHTIYTSIEQFVVAIDVLLGSI